MSLASVDSSTQTVVDDLIGAHARGRLTGRPQLVYAATEVCQLIEFMFEDGRAVPLLRTGWLDHMTQTDLRSALLTQQNIWLDARRRRGFARTTFNPLVENDNSQRNRLLLAARSAAGRAGDAGHVSARSCGIRAIG